MDITTPLTTPTPASAQTASNPANDGVAAKRATRIPMSVPTRKLEVPPMEGWHLHWFREDNVPRALQAGYVMVKAQEVQVARMGVEGAPGVSGNTDLGTNVSIVGGRAENDDIQRIFLMKIEEELYQEDQQAIASKNRGSLQSIFKEELADDGHGRIVDRQAQTYVDKSRTSQTLLNRATRKAKTVKS